MKEFLKDPKSFGGYAGLDVDDLSDDVLDKEVSVRFQTTFLPVPSGRNKKMEFATEAYNYNTTSDEDPRNLVLLCTSQGLAVQQDGAGTKKLFHHVKESAGAVKQYWLEAESSDHKVGGEQNESKAEREDALKRGKATSSVIGTKGCGTRFNVLMTIQVPLKQKMVRELDGCVDGWMDEEFETMSCISASPMDMSSMSELQSAAATFGATKKCKEGAKRGSARSGARRLPVPKGKSSAARVSRGSLVEGSSWRGLSSSPSRHENEHITCTIVMYYVVQGGTPTAEDVVNAVDDLEGLLGEVGKGKLGEEKSDFMKKELTVKDAMDIKKKMETQPPKPEKVSFFSAFPTWGGDRK